MRTETLVKMIVVGAVGALFFDWFWAVGSMAFVVALGVLPWVKRYVVSLWRVTPAGKG